MWRLYLYVDSEELATEIYFKREEVGSLWLKHHYCVLQEMVWLLKRTREFDVKIKRWR